MSRGFWIGLILCLSGSLLACQSLTISSSKPRQVYLAPDFPMTVQLPATFFAHMDIQPFLDERVQDLYEVRFEFPDRHASAGRQIVTGMLHAGVSAETLELMLLTPFGQRLARVVDHGEAGIQSEIAPNTRLHGPWLLALWQLVRLDTATLNALLQKEGLSLSTVSLADSFDLVRRFSAESPCIGREQQIVRSAPDHVAPIILAKIQSCQLEPRPVDQIKARAPHASPVQIEFPQIKVKISLIPLAPVGDTPADGLTVNLTPFQ